MRVTQAIAVPSLLGAEGDAPLAQARVQFRNMDEKASFLRKMVDRYAGNAAIRELTLEVIFPRCPAKDEPSQALAIGEWVQEHIRYVHEGAELLQTPPTTVRLGAGDCDDHTVLVGAMLQSVGIPNKLCLLKINGRWAHIFPIAIVKDAGRLHRLTLDTTLNQPIADLVNPIAIVKRQGRTVEAFFV